MIICFFSAYVTEADEVIADFRTISKNYIKTWLVVDLFGCFPSDLITVMGVNIFGSAEKILKLARVPRLVRLIKLFSLLKIFKVLKYSSYIGKFVGRYFRTSGQIRLLKIMLIACFSIHLIACFWFFSAALNDFTPATWVFRKGIVDSGPLW